jgi:hypothetical protein
VDDGGDDSGASGVVVDQDPEEAHDGAGKE